MTAVLFFSITQQAFAEEEKCDCVEGYVPCEKYHRSFSVRFENLALERAEYYAGETIKGEFDIVGAIEHPMAEGKIKVQILTHYGERAFGEDVVDEFFLPDEISYKKYSRQHVAFSWKIPENLPAGKYRAAFYYYMSSYSLGGHSDVTGLYSAAVSFDLKRKEESKDGFVYFDRTKMFVNETQYNPTTFLPEYEYGVPLTIRLSIKNSGKEKKVDVEKRIYLWDDVKFPRLLALDARNEIPETSPIKKEIAAVKPLQQTETISVPENSAQPIEYEIGVLPPEAYMVIITARYGNQKTIVPMRIPVHGIKARIAFASIASFPLKKDEKTLIGACFSISTTLGEALDSSMRIIDGNSDLNGKTAKDQNFISTIGRVEFSFYDESGNVLTQKSVNPIRIVSNMRAVEIPFIAEKGLSRGKLRVRLFDAQGILQDIEETFYDFEKFADTEISISANAEMMPSKDSPGWGEIKAMLEVRDSIGNKCNENKTVNLIAMTESGELAGTSEALLEKCSGETQILVPSANNNYKLRAMLAENNEIKTEIMVKGIEGTEKPVDGLPPAPTTWQEPKPKTNTDILLVSFAVFLAVAASLTLILRFWKKKKAMSAFLPFLVLALLLAFLPNAKGEQIDGFQLFCPTTPYEPDPACWESYVKSYLRISWEPIFKTGDGQMLTGKVLFCKGTDASLTFDQDSSISGDFMVAGGYTSCPPIVWKPQAVYNDISSWDMFRGFNGVLCTDPRVQPLVSQNSGTVPCWGCAIQGHALENITCKGCYWSPSNETNINGQILNYKCPTCTVPSGQPFTPPGTYNDVPCHNCDLSAGIASTWNIFCKGLITIKKGGATVSSFDITSAPPSINFNVPDDAKNFKVDAELYVDCLGHSGYFNGVCWNRPHYVKLNSYSQSPGPVGLPPYKDLVPATLKGGIDLTVIDPEVIFDPDKLAISDIGFTRQQVPNSTEEKVVTKFKVTNNDDYEVRLANFSFPDFTPEHKLTVLQGKNAVIQKNKSAEVVFEARHPKGLFPSNPRVEIDYNYAGYTVTCKENKASKTFTLHGFPSRPYGLIAVSANDTNVGGKTTVRVSCTEDFNAKLSLWAFKNETIQAPPLQQGVKIKCNTESKELGPLNERGVYLVVAEADITGYNCIKPECKKSKYIYAFPEMGEITVPEIHQFIAILTAIAALGIIYKKKR
ncbi:MAG: hypothetical protein QXK06_03125 [Candidatus Diapherotrites archaeon]